jgi:Zn-dependent protease with chaperone function
MQRSSVGIRSKADAAVGKCHRLRSTPDRTCRVDRPPGCRPARKPRGTATTWPVLERTWLAPSKLPSPFRLELNQRLMESVRLEHPGMVWRLEYRRTQNGRDDFNAFALPDGTIVLLDGLAEKMTSAELYAVVGHELGHVVHRHSMQWLLRQVGLLALAGVMWGDVSNLGASFAAGVQDLHYARDAEREADAFAIDFLRRAGVPTSSLADSFEVIAKEQERNGEIPEFLSSHPTTAERLQRARAAAAE